MYFNFTATKAATTVQTTIARTEVTTQKRCFSTEFLCKKSGKCIHRSWVCDGDTDCPNGEDESTETCADRTCSPSQFTCKNGNCILSHLKCDSIDHCKDNSDEEDCGSKLFDAFF